MGPKKGDSRKKEDEGQPPPPAPPPNPAVVAAESVVEKWQRRVEELQAKLTQTQQQLQLLEAQKTHREVAIKQLLDEVTEVATPRKQEAAAVTPSVGARVNDSKAAHKSKRDLKKHDETVAAPVTPPPALPTVSEEEEKRRSAKNAALLLSAFKKKKAQILEEAHVAAAAAAVTPATGDGHGGGPSVTTLDLAQVGPPRPPEIPEDLWNRVIQMRDQRIEHEDTLSTVRSSIEGVSARQCNLKAMEKVVLYSLNAASYELLRAQQRATSARTTPPTTPEASRGSAASAVLSVAAAPVATAASAAIAAAPPVKFSPAPPSPSRPSNSRGAPMRK